MYHIVPYTCALWSWFKVSSVKWKSYHVGIYLLSHLLLLTCTRCGELTPRTLYRAKSTAGVANLWPADQIRQGSPTYGLRAKYGRGRQPIECGPNAAGVAVYVRSVMPIVYCNLITENNFIFWPTYHKKLATPGLQSTRWNANCMQ